LFHSWSFKILSILSPVAQMKVIGVGGAGGNAVNRMVQSGLDGVEFIAINTDAMALDNNMADLRLQIGEKITGGLGAGANPRIGMEAMEEDRDKVKAQLEGCDMVFITAGMGGGTGTGAAPVVAEIARELGILTVGVVTKPFAFEGPVRERNCKTGLEALRKVVDTIIVIPNQKLLSIIEKTTTFREAFKLADDILTSATRGISDIILRHGDIQVDFADVKAIMSHGGDALMGSGSAVGENRAIEAADKAIHSPLLEDISISGATGVLVNIAGGEDMSMMEINDAMNFIYEAVGDESNANIIFDTVINPDAGDEVQITVIATGFSKHLEATPIAEQEFLTPKPIQKIDTLETESFQQKQPIIQPVDEAPVEPGKPLERIEAPFPPENSFEDRQTEARFDVEPGRDFIEPPTLENPIVNSKIEIETTQPVAEPSNKFDRSQSGVKGRYRESDPDTDYETPAFLRNRPDS